MIKELIKQNTDYTKTLIISKDRLDTERRKVRINKQGSKVIIGEDGYEVFSDSNKPFHRYWAEKEIYKLHKDFFNNTFNTSFEFLIVHHIDNYKTNNDAKNLAIITKELHKEINHKEIPQGNREKGIIELKRLI